MYGSATKHQGQVWLVISRVESGFFLQNYLDFFFVSTSGQNLKSLGWPGFLSFSNNFFSQKSPILYIFWKPETRPEYPIFLESKPETCFSKPGPGFPSLLSQVRSGRTGSKKLLYTGRVGPGHLGLGQDPTQPYKEDTGEDTNEARESKSLYNRKNFSPDPFNNQLRLA